MTAKKEKVAPVDKDKEAAILNPLFFIQQGLVAGKAQKNTFGSYNYRSAEDIFQAVKPLLKYCGATLIVRDELVEVGGRVYVKATATLYSRNSEVRGACTAYAREALTKKGMDDSQITGTTSSYARKYSLNGLLLIDDNKDADTDAYAKATAKPEPRIPHKEHLETQLAAMMKAETLARLNELSRSAYDYWKEWESELRMDIIVEHQKVCANAIEEKQTKKEE